MGKHYTPLIYNHTTTWHDGGVSALLTDGRIVSLSAERVDRIKHSWNSRAAYEYLKKRYPAEGFGADTDYFKDISKSIENTNHHLYHAASVFFASSLEESGILVIDGQGPEKGKLASTTIWRGHGKEIDLVEAPFLEDGKYASHSIGHFYTAIGAMAGMQNLNEEGKTMALAAYGKPSKIEEFVREYAFSNSDGTFFISPIFLYAMLGNTFGPKYYGWKNQPRRVQQIWEEFLRIRGRPIRKPHEEISQEDMDTAYVGQLVLEEIVLGLARRTQTLTGSKNICLSGGVALNGVANTKIAESGQFDKVYLFPASGDDGQSLGKLFYSIRQREVDIDIDPNRAFYGPEYSSEEIEDALRKFRHKIKIVGRGDSFVIDEAAERLSEGEVLARFFGCSEIGPRALGHRSILADPRKPAMRDHINFRVKNREWYRPLAPAVIAEETKRFFDIDFQSPFMLFISDKGDKQKETIPSATHVDGTSRIQTVTAQQDQMFYSLIRKFGEITRVPILLNTSFNRRNEPLIETPREAVEAFVNMNLEALILGDFLVVKS